MARYSSGPDRGTTWEELEGLAREEGMVSVKGAMAGAQELDDLVARVASISFIVSHYTLAALAALDQVLNAFTVDRERMAGHAATLAEAICSEALMLALARRVGKQSAHTVVYQVSQQAQQEGASLRDLLAARPDMAGLLGPDELDAIFDPSCHLGCSVAMVDAVVARAEHRLSVAGPAHEAAAP